MKNYIEELNSSLSRKEQEKETIRDQIRNLQEQKLADEKAKNDALTSGDNDAYIAAHLRIQDYEAQIAAMKDLLAAKEKVSAKPEIVAALNNTIAAFEDNRKKAIKKYQTARRELAAMFVDACHAEDEMKRIRSNYMTMGDISDLTGEVHKVDPMEPHFNEAARFFKDDLEALGYNYTAIITGQQGF